VRRRRLVPPRKRQRPAKASAVERAWAFGMLCEQEGLGQPVREHRFAPPRRWRFDYAWPPVKVALEVEGGIYTWGRHTRGAGYAKDMEKYSTAASLGWLLIRVQPNDLCQPRTLDWLRRAMESRVAA
jgi:very-short-patch-repair endonuclease